MALNYVTLTGTLPGCGGVAYKIVPSAWEFDSTDKDVFAPQPTEGTLADDLNGNGIFETAGQPGILLLATDNSHLSPGGFTYTLTFYGIPDVAPTPYTFALPFTGGAIQDLSVLI